MDSKTYGSGRDQGQNQGQSQGARGWQQDGAYGQRGKQEESFNPRAKPAEFDTVSQRGQQVDLFSQQKGKQEDLFAQQKGKQEDAFAQQRLAPPKTDDPFGPQKGKSQEDSFALQKGKQGDLFAERGRQNDFFSAENARANTTVRIDDGSRGSQPILSGGNPPLESRSNTFGNFSFDSEQRQTVQPHPTPYASVAGDAELHGVPHMDLMHNPAVDTMVKMVTMLNFMKVELGETKTLRSKEQWRAAGAEFIGTLLFVYLGCGSVVATGMLFAEMTPARLLVIAVAHGLAICFLTGATGAISGGHLNPAVTLAFVVAGKENLVRAGLYVGAQLLGAIFGALFLKFSTPESLQGTLGSHDISEFIYTSQGFLMEMILTFVLVFVIFGVAVDRRGPGVIAPIPIGFAVLVDHIVGVPYTGASMNPARSFGPALVSGNFGSAHLVYWVAPGLGATAAAALYRYAFLEPAEAASRTATMLAPPR